MTLLAKLSRLLLECPTRSAVCGKLLCACTPRIRRAGFPALACRRLIWRDEFWITPFQLSPRVHRTLRSCLRWVDRAAAEATASATVTNSRLTTLERSKASRDDIPRELYS